MFDPFAILPAAVVEKAEFASFLEELGGIADPDQLGTGRVSHGRRHVWVFLKIREGLTRNPAALGRTDRYGQRFTVDMTIAGPKGSRVVRTSWIIEPGSTTPRLSTVFVK